MVVKKFVRPLAAGAGLTGAIAAFNRSVSNAPAPANELHGLVRRWDWRGHGVFATELGSGPLMILIHGVYAGASSYEFRKIAPLLAQTHRVVAFDLLGCGLSDRPNLGYSADLFAEQIVDAIAEFGSSEPVTLFGSSLGAAFTIRAAARATQRIAALITSCPAGLGGILDGPPTGAQRALASAIRSPLAGEALFNALSSRPSIRFFLGQTYGDKRSVTPEVVDHYYAVGHQSGARYVPAHFVGGLLNCNVAQDLPFVDAPLMIAWGERASAFSPLANAGEFLKLGQNAKLVTFADSGMLPHEEEPGAMHAAIAAFLPPVHA